MFRQISILGPGLLGASVSLAARKHGLAKRIVAWSRRPETRAKCLSKQICDAVTDTAQDAVVGSDCVILCTPVETILPLLEQIQPALSEDALLTDVGSTKSLICHQAQAITNQAKPIFIGSHPMAGSERFGMEHARADLFEGATCFITPLDSTPQTSLRQLRKFWEAIGMTIQISSPELHDKIVAHISHLPHALAAVLCKFLAEKNCDWAQFAGGGLRDSTRIASGDPTLWNQIFSQNREEVISAIEDFEHELHQFKSDLLNNETIKTHGLLQKGKAFRDGFRT